MTTHHQHRTDDELLVYRLGLPGKDDAIEDDLANCQECARHMEENERFLTSLRDPETWRAAGEDPTARIKEGLARLDAELARRPGQEREAVTRRFLDAATAALDQSPDEALALLEMAEASTQDLDRRAAAEYRCEIWKNRANAYRMTGDYDAALRATDRAARYTRLSPTGAYALGIVIYTRGTVLFKMGRYAEANDCADAAIEYLREFGDRQRIAYATNLKGGICIEDGRLKEAVAIYEELRPQMETLGDAVGMATVTANLATTNVRLGNLNAGRKFAIEALQRFLDLGSDADEIRMKWVLASIRAAEGDPEDAIDKFRAVAASFESLGMHGDAARVSLDIAQELLRGEEWAELEVIAREAAEAFARNDTRLYLAEALAYLRYAVERRTATPDLLEYIRTYFEVDRPDQLFRPPN